MTLAWRSLLFTPADDHDRLAKAHTRGADAVVLDLEDAVAPAAKAAARAGLAEQAARLAAAGQAVAVRINRPWLLAAADLEAAIVPAVSAVMAPKAEDPNALAVLGEMIGELEDARGLAPGRIGLIALVETPKGVARAAELALVERVVGLALGPEDLADALGRAPNAESLDLPCRLLALAAAQRGLMALGAPISIADFEDVDGLEAAARRARAFGMTGGLCIHPRQAGALNRAFQPSAEEVDDASRVLAAWTAAGGAGVARLDGRMIDLPVARRAERTLRAGAPAEPERR